MDTDLRVIAFYFFFFCTPEVVLKSSFKVLARYQSDARNIDVIELMS